jgi:hypothetical protein
VTEDSKLLPCPFCGKRPVVCNGIANCGSIFANGKPHEFIAMSVDDWNRRAAPVNAMSGEVPKTITCEACEGPVEYDLLVSDDLWAKIAPRQVEGWKGGGALCPSCILDRSIVVASTPRPSSELVAALRDRLDDAHRSAGQWEDAHRELLNAVLSCCDPEMKVCGLHPGPERIELEAVIARQHTVHSDKGPFVSALTTEGQTAGVDAGEALDRLREIAYRDSAVSVTVLAAELRAHLEATQRYVLQQTRRFLTEERG